MVGEKEEIFTLGDSNVYCINLGLRFYSLTTGLIDMPNNFLMIIKNREDRNLLKKNEIGKTGIKKLTNDILVIKPVGEERLLMMGLKVNKKTFFLPVKIVPHQKWEEYASNPQHTELDKLRTDLKGKFKISKVNEPVVGKQIEVVAKLSAVTQLKPR